jgi:hypothetical protein
MEEKRKNGGPKKSFEDFITKIAPNCHPTLAISIRGELESNVGFKKENFNGNSNFNCVDHQVFHYFFEGSNSQPETDFTNMKRAHFLTLWCQKHVWAIWGHDKRVKNVIETPVF